jgi:hypothetical protein
MAEESLEAKQKPTWSRLLLWPGFILLGIHTMVVMNYTDQALSQGNVSGFARFMGVATVVPTLTTALLIAGFVSLVLEHHTED